MSSRACQSIESSTSIASKALGNLLGLMVATISSSVSYNRDDKLLFKWENFTKLKLAINPADLN